MDIRTGSWTSGSEFDVASLSVCDDRALIAERQQHDAPRSGPLEPQLNGLQTTRAKPQNRRAGRYRTSALHGAMRSPIAPMHTNEVLAHAARRRSAYALGRFHLARCQSLGCESDSAFSISFKPVMGCLPGQYTKPQDAGISPSREVTHGNNDSQTFEAGLGGLT